MGDDAADQFQHSWIERIVQGADGGTIAAGCGHILHQIIASDGKELDLEEGDYLRLSERSAAGSAFEPGVETSNGPDPERGLAAK